MATYFSLGGRKFGNETECWVNLDHSAFAQQTQSGCALLETSKDIDVIKHDIETLKRQLDAVAEAAETAAAEQRAK